MAPRIVPDPIAERGWSELLERHPEASIFHSAGWLNTLRQTYGYQPFVVTTSKGSALDNGLVACRVKGWKSSRIVSLPFSDHCQPLFDFGHRLGGEIANGRACSGLRIVLEERQRLGMGVDLLFEEARVEILVAGARQIVDHPGVA